MEESGFIEYWITWLFAFGFCLWFPTYVIKTKGHKLPTWGLAFCIVVLFLVLPLIAVGFIRDIIPSLWLSFENAGFEAPSIQMLVGSFHKMATLDQVYVSLACFFILVGIGQSVMASWLLYIRHNRESLLRAIRFMWCSAFMDLCAVGIFPVVILRDHGFSVVTQAAPMYGIYVACLIGVTVYLSRTPEVQKFYPISHMPKKAKK